MRALEQILVDAREEAQMLRANRTGFGVDRVEEILKEVSVAAEPYITWLSEGDAAIRAGVSVDTMRGRFPAMERDGNARLAGRARQYRQCAVPQRAQTAAAASRARVAARREVGA